jgi:hypothetical protein
MNAMCRIGGVAKSVSVIATMLLASLTGRLSAQSGCTPQPSGLVGWWKGDSNANDTIGGNNGTMQNGASFAAGEVNQAFAFNGTNQFVAIPDAPALNPTNSLTVETWVYVSGRPSVDVATIVTKQSTTVASDIQYQLESYNSPGGLTFRCTVYLPTGYAFVNGKTNVQLNTWYHIAMTYDNASLKLYVNGALDGSVAASGPIAPTTEPLRIGGAGSGSWFFNGRVDEVSLYERALSLAELQAIFNAGAAGKCVAPLLCEPPPAGLVGWWKGDSNAVDIIGGNNGTLQNGATFAAGEVNQAFAFNGTNQFLQIPDAPALDPTNSLTIETWAYVSGPPSVNVATIITKQGTTTPSDIQYQLESSVLSGKLTFRCTVYLPTGYAVVDGTNQVQLNTWYHVAMTYDNASLKLYVNGALDGSVAASGAIAPTAEPLRIGGAGSGPWFFNGRVDEASLYNRALSPAEIQAIYNAGAAGKCAAPSVCQPPPVGLVGWWKGDSNTVDTVGGNNGTLQNGASFAVGEVNQAFAFNGSNQFVQIPDAPPLDPTNLLTVETWAYVGGPPSVDVATIVTKQGTTIPSDIQYQLETYNSPGGLTFRCTVYLPTGYAFVNGTNHVQLNTWYHIAMTYDNASLKLYVNGALDGSVAASGPIAPTAEPLRIGGAGSGPWFFNGRVDEASLYNRALAPSEILAIYKAGTAGKCTTPTAPTIITQPQSQTAHVGDTVTFTVSAVGSSPLSYQWEKNAVALSGATTSALSINGVQAGDAGNYSVVVSNIVGAVTSSNAVLTVTGPVACVTPPGGLISWWKAEGNAQDVAGINGGTLMGSAGFAAGEVGSGFSFNGSGQFVQVPDSPSLRLTNELTVELWYKDTGATQGHFYGLFAKRAPYPTGCNYGMDMFVTTQSILQVYFQDPHYSGYTASQTPLPAAGAFHHLAATFRQAASEQVELKTYIDGQLAQTATVSGNLARTVNNAPVTIGADDPNETYFVGVIDEPTIYDRALSAAEINGIYNAGSAGKCNAAFPPTIITQPGSQTAQVGDTVSIAAVAGGSAPLTYLWQFNGAPILGATNTSLILSNVSLASAGSYLLVVTNVAGAITSNPAILTVTLPPASIALGTSTVSAEGTITTPVNLIANGNENAVSFTLDFNPSLLTNSGVALGSGASGASLQVNTSQASAGRVGVAIALPAGQTFSAGTQQVAVATFSSAIITTATSTSVSFGNSPVTNLVVDVSGKPLAATFVPGTVLLPPSQLEGDVYPRPNGDQALTVSDWVLVGRYVAGLDAPTNALEFQKADCAPRATLGDGKLTVSDWVQAGRYAAGLDPATRAGGPTGGLPAVVSKEAASSIAPRTQSTLRQVRVSAPVLAQGQAGTVQVVLEARGNENALGFSLNFDPAQLVFAGATAGTAANGAVLNVNASQAAEGRLGFVLALKANQSFAAGSQQVINLTFRPTPSASGNSAISFGDQPVVREISDPNASALAAEYINGAATMAPLPSLSITASGKSISVSWPAAASGFVLQESSDANLGAANWTAVAATPAVVNSRSVVSLPLGPDKKFYRLYHP